MAQKLNFYTRLYDNFLDDEMCDAYVAAFEETMKKDAEEERIQVSALVLFVLTVIRFVVHVIVKE